MLPPLLSSLPLSPSHLVVEASKVQRIHPGLGRKEGGVGGGMTKWI
jgi:hypothetical protein